MIKRSRICCEIIPHYISINDNSQRITLIENLRLSGKDIEFVEVFDYTAGEAHYNTLSDGTVLNVDEEELTNTWLVLVNQSREIINRVSFTDILQRQLHGCPLSLRGCRSIYLAAILCAQARKQPASAQLYSYCSVYHRPEPTKKLKKFKRRRLSII